MRTLLPLALLALAFVLAPAAVADHAPLQACYFTQVLDDTCTLASTVANAAYHYAECYLFDEGPANWIQCL